MDYLGEKKHIMQCIQIKVESFVIGRALRKARRGEGEIQDG